MEVRAMSHAATFASSQRSVGPRRRGRCRPRRRRDLLRTDLMGSTVHWVFGAAALVVLVLGVVFYRLAHRDDDRQTAAIVSFIVGADLLVLAVNAALV